MSGYFVCVQPETPCQAVHQVAVTEVTVQDLAALGVTPQSLSAAVGLGFALVFAMAMLGFVPGLLIRLIRRL